MSDQPTFHQPRDFVGYGPNPPWVEWPGGAKLAINLVLNYEEGSEYQWLIDGRNDNWGEYNLTRKPAGARSRHRDAFRIWQPGGRVAAGADVRPL